MADIVRVYSNSQVLCAKIEALLMNAGIPTIVRNDFQSGNIAGFSGGLPDLIDVYVENKNVKRALSIIRDSLLDE